MSSKAIVLKRNSNDAAKLKALQGLAPQFMVEYSSGGQLAAMTNNFGTLDYLLVTGGHGDFVNKKPSKFNDADIVSAKKWISNVKGTFKVIVLDTCFSSALAGSFLPFLTNGGSLVCAHGTAEGWADGFVTGNNTRTIGELLADVVDNFGGLGSFASVSLAIKKPINQLLYTGNAGTDRKDGLNARANMDMEVDSELELKEVDIYLARDRIDVVATKPDALKKLLKETITTTIV